MRSYLDFMLPQHTCLENEQAGLSFLGRFFSFLKSSRNTESYIPVPEEMMFLVHSVSFRGWNRDNECCQEKFANIKAGTEVCL